MRAKEFTIKEDELDNLLQAKGLAPKTNSPAQQFADALEAEDDIAKIASGKLDPKSIPSRAPFTPPGVDTRMSGPADVAKAKATAIPTQNVKPKSLPPVKPTTVPVVAKPKIEIKQAAGSVPWRDIARHCKQKWNMSITQIAGMMANIAHESGFRSGIETIDSNGLPSGGLFQHNGPRFAQLKQKLGPSWKDNWQGQIDFALTEPDGARYIGREYPSADAASRAWTHKFERPANAKVQAAKRAPTATKYASNL
jgi:hypothetical protein